MQSSETARTSPAPASAGRPRRPASATSATVAWALVVALPGTMIVLPSLSRLAFLVRGAVPADATDVAFATHRFLGLGHIVPGLVLAALVPVQLSTRVRARWPALHRKAGWLFVLCALCVLGSAGWMNVTFPRIGGLWKVAAIDVMIVGLAVTLGLALVAIKRGDVLGHRRWMLRMLAFALAGGTAGVVLFPLFLMFGPPGDAAVAVGRWLSIAFNVAFVEAFLRWRGKQTAPHAA